MLVLSIMLAKKTLQCIVRYIKILIAHGKGDRKHLHLILIFQGSVLCIGDLISKVIINIGEVLSSVRRDTVIRFHEGGVSNRGLCQKNKNKFKTLVHSLENHNFTYAWLPRLPSTRLI